MKAHFAMLAAHSLWANELLFARAESLDRTMLEHGPGGDAPTLSQLLNDMIAFDQTWLSRFTGMGTAHGGTATTTLSPATLRVAKQAEDRRLAEWLSSLPPERIAGRFSYMNLNEMRTISQRLAPALAHYFDSQSHYRGMACALMLSLDIAPPRLDLATFQKSDQGRAFA